ncbi:hypothetical protein [Roseovarius rhodophyticola]|uniref:Uncharacterized protein n=1 Tax=Roseovarius rhodophyticola TaxID=3080827 RepID=A0ABZ2TF61_9RHOB|nr:hypothetical protein [Roseovarius sp. W115]MDV2928611.1 hypothetical protein [Roseovarius sp. W115]
MKRLLLSATLALAPVAGHAAEGERVQVKGEIIDTWCYYSGVMGGLTLLSARRITPVRSGVQQGASLLAC